MLIPQDYLRDSYSPILKRIVTPSLPGTEKLRLGGSLTSSSMVCSSPGVHFHSLLLRPRGKVFLEGPITGDGTHRAMWRTRGEDPPAQAKMSFYSHLRKLASAVGEKERQGRASAHRLRYKARSHVAKETREILEELSWDTVPTLFPDIALSDNDLLRPT